VGHVEKTRGVGRHTKPKDQPHASMAKGREAVRS
jgi:hypothetical protein